VVHPFSPAAAANDGYEFGVAIKDEVSLSRQEEGNPGAYCHSSEQKSWISRHALNCYTATLHLCGQDNWKDTGAVEAMVYARELQGASAPSAGALLQLHGRLLDGETSARDEIAGILLQVLIRATDERFGRVDVEIRHDAVVDEVLSYLRHPAEFCPTERLSLDRLIASRIRRRIGHNVRSAVRRQSREQTWAGRFSGFEDPRYPD
jgi:hypothetical protein